MRENCCSSTQYLAVAACDPWNCCGNFTARRKDITNLPNIKEKNTWVLMVSLSPENVTALPPDFLLDNSYLS